MRIAQSEDYQGDDWWEWAVWIEGCATELDSVRSVTYTLHSSFKNPVQEIKDRSSKFKLATAGWGIFTVYARVNLEDGGTKKLSHSLKLTYPDGRVTSA